MMLLQDTKRSLISILSARNWSNQSCLWVIYFRSKSELSDNTKDLIAQLFVQQPPFFQTPWSASHETGFIPNRPFLASIDSDRAPNLSLKKE